MRAARVDAPDLHIEPLEKRLRARVRVDGVLQSLGDLPADFAPQVISRVKVLAGADIAERRLHQDGRIAVKVDGREVDIRVSTRASVFGETLVLPPLPEIASRLMQLLRDEDAADPRNVAELVGNEPAMTASILRMANPASFGGLRPVAELDEAIARLGMRQVGALVTTVAHKGHFESDDPEMKSLLHGLWDHAVASALAAKHLTALGEGDRTEAFIAGLLHDTGKLLALKGLDQLERQGNGFTPSVAEELMNLLHTELGHTVLRSWKIAEPICRVALHHHDSEPAPDDLLLLRVQAANTIARKLGAHPHPDPDLDLFEAPSIERLNIGDLELAALMVDVEDEIHEVRRLL
jgi:HD-like signal output (HDOD) protein